MNRAPICLQEVDLTHGRLKAIPDVIVTLKKVKVLTLRQNLIPDMAPLSGLRTLQELDLYDNELTAITGLDDLNELTYVYIRVKPIMSRDYHTVPG